MGSHSKNDPSFIYHNTFENTIFAPNQSTADMSDSSAVLKDPALQSFTATGRPFKPNKGSAMTSLSHAESWGAGVPNLLPVRFTDNSIISVPVMPSKDTAETKLVEAKLVDSEDEDDDGPVKQPKPTKRFSFSAFRRKSSSKKEKKPDFVMKDMTRAEYLKHYAKDDDGNYIGTEDPAIDCILNNENDRFKKRKKVATREAFATTLQPAGMFM